MERLPSPDPELTVGDLLELLAEYDPQTPLRLATQPAWAFAYTLAAIAAHDNDQGFLYLAAGEQLGYLPDTARRALTEAGDHRWTTYP
jgi:hypothetical protein